MPDNTSLQIAIIGAGMGGLGCALALAKKGFKKIDVYETASNLGFVGAGIQAPPNVIRVLSRLGCWDEIGKEATYVKGASIRKGSTNVELSHIDFPNIQDQYGYPHCTVHRSSLAGGLFDACKKESAITFHFSTAVVGIDSFSPKPSMTVKPRDGEPYTVSADAILAADGVKSVTRGQLLAQLGKHSEEEDTGQAAYRIMLKRADMASDPEMLALIDADAVVRWIAERRHIIAYPVSGKTVYNLSSVQPDVNFANATNATYTTRGSKKAMLDVFGDFCPLVRRMLDLVPDGEVCEWKLRVHKTLPAWVVGGVALLGDAAHPTLPHLNQGAAMAIEDGAVLAEVLSRAPARDADAIHKCLEVYERLRKDWTANIVDMAAASARTLHLGEGKAREERDRQFAEAAKTGKVPDKWASPDVQEMIYANDCMKIAAERFDELYASLK